VALATRERQSRGRRQRHATSRDQLRGSSSALFPIRLGFTATDRQDPSVQASTSLLVAPFGASTSFAGRFITAHTKVTWKGRVTKTVRLGRVSGPCGAFKTTIRRWPIKNPARGYSPRTRDRHGIDYLLTGG
jgi:hypothetical protein